MAQILTQSGGLVETMLNQDRMYGTRFYLHIDHSANVNNGEGDQQC
jgi:hypothetical protein